MRWAVLFSTATTKGSKRHTRKQNAMTSRVRRDQRDESDNRHCTHQSAQRDPRGSAAWPVSFQQKLANADSKPEDDPGSVLSLRCLSSLLFSVQSVGGPFAAVSSLPTGGSRLTAGTHAFHARSQLHRRPPCGWIVPGSDGGRKPLPIRRSYRSRCWHDCRNVGDAGWAQTHQPERRGRWLLRKTMMWSSWEVARRASCWPGAWARRGSAWQ